jgi:hypothetical protein
MVHEYHVQPGAEKIVLRRVLVSVLPSFGGGIAAGLVVMLTQRDASAPGTPLEIAGICIVFLLALLLVIFIQYKRLSRLKIILTDHALQWSAGQTAVTVPYAHIQKIEKDQKGRLLIYTAQKIPAVAVSPVMERFEMIERFLGNVRPVLLAEHTHWLLRTDVRMAWNFLFMFLLFVNLASREPVVMILSFCGLISLGLATLIVRYRSRLHVANTGGVIALIILLFLLIGKNAPALTGYLKHH